MKFNPLDIFIDITQGFDIYWTKQKKLAIGMCALALGLMTFGLVTAELWPFVGGIVVCIGNVAAAFVIGRES